MNKNSLMLYGSIAAAFAVMGAVVAVNKPAPAPLTTAIAPTGGKPHTAVTTLLTQSMNDAAGKAQALSAYQGKPLLVNFWATWCAPCVQEMPELSALAKDTLGKKVAIIGIGIDSPTNIAEFASKYKIAYPVFNGGMAGTDLAREFGNTAGGLPYTVLIGADGQVKKTYLGRLKFEELKKDLAAL